MTLFSPSDRKGSQKDFLHDGKEPHPLRGWAAPDQCAGKRLAQDRTLCSWIKLAWCRLRAQEGVRGPVRGHLPTCTPQPELALMATGFQEAPVPVKLQCEACWPAFIQYLLRTFYMPCAVTGTKKTEFSLLKFPIACQEGAWEGSRKGTGPCLQSHELTVLM